MKEKLPSNRKLTAIAVIGVLALIVLLYLICRVPEPETVPTDSNGAEIEFFEMGGDRE